MKRDGASGNYHVVEILPREGQGMDMIDRVVEVMDLDFGWHSGAGWTSTEGTWNRLWTMIQESDSHARED